MFKTLLGKYKWYGYGIVALIVLGTITTLWVQLTLARGEAEKKGSQLEASQAALSTANSRITELSRDLQDTKETMDDNRRVYEASLEQFRASSAIADRALSDLRRRQAAFQDVREEIEDVPEDQIQPVSPFLCWVVDRLYVDSAATGSACSNRDNQGTADLSGD